jgi:tight adherence protein B
MSETIMLTLAIAFMAALSIGSIGYAFLSPTLSGRELSHRRVKAITRGEAVSSTKKGPLVDKSRDRRKAIQDTLKDIEQKKKEARTKLSLRGRIEQAGLTITPTVFYSASAIVCVLVGLITFMSGLSSMISITMAFTAAFGLPRWALSYLAKRRQKAFLKEFPNAVDVIVRGVKSGLPLNECLQIVANETSDPVGEEFRTLVESQRLGVPTDQALGRLYARMPTQEVNFFSIVISIQTKSGGNLSEALGNLSAVLRARKMLKEKIKAMSSEARASAGIIGSLPPLVMLFVYMTTPEYITLLFTERLGNALLVGSALWMASGIYIMKKMISFKH